jgi:hypothetical protein
VKQGVEGSDAEAALEELVDDDRSDVSSSSGDENVFRHGPQSKAPRGQGR